MKTRAHVWYRWFDVEIFKFSIRLSSFPLLSPHNTVADATNCPRMTCRWWRRSSLCARALITKISMNGRRNLRATVKWGWWNNINDACYEGDFQPSNLFWSFKIQQSMYISIWKRIYWIAITPGTRNTVLIFRRPCIVIVASVDWMVPAITPSHPSSIRPPTTARDTAHSRCDHVTFNIQSSDNRLCLSVLVSRIPIRLTRKNGLPFFRRNTGWPDFLQGSGSFHPFIRIRQQA